MQSVLSVPSRRRRALLADTDETTAGIAFNAVLCFRGIDSTTARENANNIKVLDPVGETDAVGSRADSVHHEAQAYPDIALHEAEEKLDVVGLEAEVLVHVLNRRTQ